MTNTLKVSEPRAVELIVEKDVKIPMRDGAVLYADLLTSCGFSITGRRASTPAS